MTHASLVNRRRIDSGDQLLLWDPPPGSATTAYAVATLVCMNPQCPCTEMHFVIRPAHRTGSTSFDVRGESLRGHVSTDGFDSEFDDVPSAAFPSELLSWIREQLSDGDRRAWLRERWVRSRGQIGDPAYPSGVLPEGIEGMFAFHEVFPYDFDLLVGCDHRTYLIEDHYCLQPACRCDNSAVAFYDVTKDSDPVDGLNRQLGHVRVSSRRLRVTQFEGPPLIRELWTAFLEEYGPTLLAERYKRLKASARDQRTATVIELVGRPRVGRNDPCPCGSGKKFKRCCDGQSVQSAGVDK